MPIALEYSLTATSICNISLAALGQGELSDVETDEGPEADACRRFYSIARKDVLREHSWAFGTVQEPLVENPSVDEDDYPEYTYFYSYPSSCLTVWAVFNEVTVTEKWEQEFEKVYNPTLNEHIILTDQEDAFAEYTYDVTDMTIWDSKFVMAFAYRLAAMMAKQITGDGAISEAMMSLSNAYISEAKRVGASEKRKVIELSSKYINARA